MKNNEIKPAWSLFFLRILPDSNQNHYNENTVVFFSHWGSLNKICISYYFRTAKCRHNVVHVTCTFEGAHNIFVKQIMDSFAHGYLCKHAHDRQNMCFWWSKTLMATGCALYFLFFVAQDGCLSDVNMRSSFGQIVHCSNLSQHFLNW